MTQTTALLNPSFTNPYIFFDDLPPACHGELKSQKQRAEVWQRALSFTAQPALAFHYLTEILNMSPFAFVKMSPDERNSLVLWCVVQEFRSSTVVCLAARKSPNVT